jgi:4a-hydroxytetrahydrobiopterin dehydratase
MSLLAQLAANHCRPMQGPENLLPDQALRQYMALLPGWELAEEGQALRKTFLFDDYYRTMAFVNAMAYIAHFEDHHPDLSVHYNRCVVRYSTHDVGGLSYNDVICAAKVELLKP